MSKRSIRPELMRPSPFRMAEEQEWIACDWEGCEGFAILVRTDITNAEQAALTRAHDAIVAGQEAWAALPPDGQDLHQSPKYREWALIAPYVLDWNAEGRTIEGEWKPIPPPAEAGVDAFECITKDAATWVNRVVLVGYLALGKARQSVTKSGSFGSTSEEPEDTEGREDASLLPNSSPPSESASTA